jgi:hypothetical protein
MIWPFGTLLLAIRNFTEKHYRFVILLFSILFGYSVYLYSGDILRFEQAFAQVLHYSWSDYWHLLTHTFSSDKLTGYSQNVVNSKPDIFALTLQFITSRFTENPRWFWAILNLIYTYFFIQFLSEVLDEMNWTRSLTQMAFFVYLILIIPYYAGVTGVRMWTAVFIFMYYALKYVKYSQWKYLLFASASIMVHYTMIVPMAILILYKFVPLNRIIISLLVVLSIGFFLASSNNQILGIIESNLDRIGISVLEENVEGYLDDDKLSNRQERSGEQNWYVKLKDESIHYFLVILFIINAFGIFKWEGNEFTKKLFPLLLIFFTLTLMTYNLGSVGRFKYIFYSLCLINYSVLAGLNPDSQSFKVVSRLLLPFLFLHILVYCRALFYWIDPLLIIGNPVVIYLFRSEESLSEFIVGH